MEEYPMDYEEFFLLQAQTASNIFAAQSLLGHTQVVLKTGPCYLCFWTSMHKMSTPLHCCHLLRFFLMDLVCVESTSATLHYLIGMDSQGTEIGQLSGL